MCDWRVAVIGNVVMDVQSWVGWSACESSSLRLGIFWLVMALRVMWLCCKGSCSVVVRGGLGRTATDAAGAAGGLWWMCSSMGGCFVGAVRLLVLMHCAVSRPGGA